MENDLIETEVYEPVEENEAGKNQGPMIYVGPGYRDTQLSTFNIFADGIPETYRDHPIYQHLFVPPEKLNEARAEVKSKGSMLHVFYQQAVEDHEKKKGGNK